MAKIFISYSSPDQAAADQIRAALETAGLPCWIAPRDLRAGTQWGAGIVEAIRDCDAVLVVFSQAANNSPQVSREMESAVANRRPLIPIRVVDVLPTDDMQYFLGVSHWFNAYAQPLPTYLPEIVASVKGVLARQRNPWSSITRRLPRSRNAQVLVSLGVAVLVALVIGLLLRTPNPMQAMSSPLGGRWQTRLPRGSADCVMDVPSSGLSAMASFSDGCPAPLTSASGMLSAIKDATFAPSFYQPGDTGSFMFQGSGGNFSGAFRIGFFGGLTTRDPRFGEISWTRASADRPVANAADAVLSPSAAWPLEAVPAVVARADEFIRGHWTRDAVLMSLDLKPGAAGGVQATFTFYSPSNQQGRFFIPNMMGAGLMAPYGHADDLRHAVADRFIDLPEALTRARRAGMRSKDITEAKLEWSGGDACGTGNFRIDNAILPKCRPGRFVGLQWEIESGSGERYYVPAAP